MLRALAILGGGAIVATAIVFVAADMRASRKRRAHSATLRAAERRAHPLIHLYNLDGGVHSAAELYDWAAGE